MSNTLINARITELEGPVRAYYDVHLEWLPRAGDLIHLHSNLDAKSGHTAQHLYEVVRVIHQLSDIDKNDKTTHKDSHFVQVTVKPSELLKSGEMENILEEI